MSAWRQRETATLGLSLAVFFIFQFLWPQLPMPWPDESIFFTSGRDLVEKQIWHMPVWSYLGAPYTNANFNLMPLYSLLVYGWIRLVHLESVAAVPIFQIILSAPTLVILYVWFKKSCASPSWRRAALGLFLSAPFLYYNAHTLRPETLISTDMVALCYLAWHHSQLQGGWKRWGSCTLIALLLAVGAYLHFNAIVLIPMVCLLMWDRRHLSRTMTDLIVIGGITIVLLSPWCFYASRHLEEFRVMFFDQTHRMYTSPEHRLVSWNTIFKIWLTPILLGMTSGHISFLVVYIFYAVTAAGLCVWHVTHHTLSELTRRLGYCLLWTIIFHAFHQEQWFRVYVEIGLMIFLCFLFLDTVGKANVPALAWVAIITIIVTVAAPLINSAHRVYSKDNFSKSVACLIDKIPPRQTVVVAALPDPSLAILLARPDIVIQRMADFDKYRPEWIKLVNRETYFITADYTQKPFNGSTLIPHDFGAALEKRLRLGDQEHRLQQVSCPTGNIPLYRFVISEQKS